MIELEKRKTNVKHPSIHPSIFSHLSGARMWGQQQPEQRRPDLPLPNHFLQLIRGNTEVFPGQSGDIISPVCPGYCPGSSQSLVFIHQWGTKKDGLGVWSCGIRFIHKEHKSGVEFQLFPHLMLQTSTLTNTQK